jgi:hypothetical protein
VFGNTLIIDGGDSGLGCWECGLDEFLAAPRCNDTTDLHVTLKGAIMDILAPMSEPVEEILLLATVSKRLNHTRFSHEDFLTACDCLNGAGTIVVTRPGGITSYALSEGE